MRQDLLCLTIIDNYCDKGLGRALALKGVKEANVSIYRGTHRMATSEAQYLNHKENLNSIDKTKQGTGAELGFQGM